MWRLRGLESPHGLTWPHLGFGEPMAEHEVG